jgi:hypothetical protein
VPRTLVIGRGESRNRYAKRPRKKFGQIIYGVDPGLIATAGAQVNGTTRSPAIGAGPLAHLDDRQLSFEQWRLVQVLGEIRQPHARISMPKNSEQPVSWRAFTRPPVRRATSAVIAVYCLKCPIP